MDGSDAPDRRQSSSLRRQALVADLGQQALDGHDLDQLMSDACDDVAAALDTEFAGALELLADGDAVLRQGVGWHDGLVGAATVPTDQAFQAGYTLGTETPVVVDDLGTETRFTRDELLASHDVVSGISTTIGSGEEPWGVLWAHSTDRREFTREDATFVQNVANILASAVARWRCDHEFDRARQRIQVALTETGATVWEWDFERDAVTRHLDTLGLVRDGAETVDDCLASIHPDDRPRVRAALAEAVEDRSPYRVDYRFDAGDATRWAESYGEVSAPSNGTGPRMINVVRDITARKERERAIEASERRYRTLAENFPQGAVGLFDRNLRFTAAGGELLEESRNELGEPMGDSILERYPDEVLVELEPQVRGALAGEHGMCEIDCCDRHLLVYTLPVPDADGEVAGGMLVVLDVTEQREYRHRLQASHERLEEFASAVSHDLREPLGTIASYLQLLERRYDDTLDEDATEFIEFAVEGAERMRVMIDGLVTAYTRTDTGPESYEPVDLGAVLEDVRADLQAKIDEHNAQIATGPLPHVAGDSAQLRQLLLNLLDNAIKYAGDAPPRIDVSARPAGAEWVISVSDAGIGMDPDQAEDVFDVFHRLHPEETYPGTGIGLALCEHIVERHDGEIWVDAEPETGSTFSFTLPAVDPQE